MDLFTAAHELYGVPPSEFMESRTRLVAQARRAGDQGLAKRIGALRRPTVAAWAVNRLSREAGDDVGRLLDVGTELRAAWESGGSIGGLEQRRGELVALLLRAAGELAADAGHPLRDPALREIEDTLQAATVDPEVAEEVRIGHLTRSRRHAGFVPAGMPAAWQATPTPLALPRPERPARARRTVTERAREREEAEARRREERRRQAEEARLAADKAVAAMAEWEAEVGRAEAELNEIGTEAENLRSRLDATLARRTTVQRRLRVAEREHTRASRRAEEARRRAAEAERER